MESKLFVDSDVIIDFLIDREPHTTISNELFELADTGEIMLFTSSLSINNIHYIARKIIGESKTREVIGELMAFIDILSVEKQHLQYALLSEFKDFEDAIQHEVALSNKEVKAIITRNTKDYRKSKIAVLEPRAILELLKR
ncbi:MAG: PIN domain-containing protein [Bacteroidota bacterium]